MQELKWTAKTCYTDKKEANCYDDSQQFRSMKKVEKEAEKLFSDFGLDISTAVNIFLRQSIRENCIPFNIQKEVPNADTLAAMKESEDMIAHPEKYKGYHDVDEMMKDLLA